MLIRSQVPCLILNCFVFLLFCLFGYSFFSFLAFAPLLLADNWWPSISLCNMVVVSRKKVSLERFFLQRKGVNQWIHCNTSWGGELKLARRQLLWCRRGGVGETAVSEHCPSVLGILTIKHPTNRKLGGCCIFVYLWPHFNIKFTILT